MWAGPVQGRLRGLWTHTEGGFYHDGRFATLLEVVDHYDQPGAGPSSAAANRESQRWSVTRCFLLVSWNASSKVVDGGERIAGRNGRGRAVHLPV